MLKIDLGVSKYLSLEIFINSFLRLNIVNPAKLQRLVQGLLSVEKWQSDCEMLQCAADDYASTMHESDRWCRLSRDNG